MSLLPWLFRRGIKQNVSDDSNNSSVFVDGTQAGLRIAKLIKQARHEGWNPIPSVKLKCTGCEASVSLTNGVLSSESFVFIHPDGQCQGLDDQLHCRKCKSTRFCVTLHPTTFQEWLRGILSQVSPSEQDPAVGFREDKTGQMVRDRTLVKAATFDELWRSIAKAVDPQGGMNPCYSFNMIGTRHLDRSVPGVAHHNRATDTLITIIKPQNGNYWYSVQSL